MASANALYLLFFVFAIKQIQGEFQQENTSLEKFLKYRINYLENCWNCNKYPRKPHRSKGLFLNFDLSPWRTWRDVELSAILRDYFVNRKIVGIVKDAKRQIQFISDQRFEQFGKHRTILSLHFIYPLRNHTRRERYPMFGCQH